MSEYVTVETAANEAIAEMIKQRLDEAGIPCMLVASGMASFAGAGATYTVNVPAEQAAEARELLGG